MDCRRRWAVDDDRSRRIRLAVDDDRRRGRWVVDDDRSCIAFYQAEVKASLDRIDKNLRSIRRTRMSSATIPAFSPSLLSAASRDRKQFRNQTAVVDDDPPLQLPLRWRDPPPDRTVCNHPTVVFRDLPPLKHAISRSDLLEHSMSRVTACSESASNSSRHQEHPHSRFKHNLAVSTEKDGHGDCDLETHIGNERLRRPSAVVNDPHREAFLVAEVKASLARIDALCVKSMHSLERIMSWSATMPASSPLCSSNMNAQLTLLQRDPSVTDIDFIEGVMSRSDPPSEPTPLPSLQLPFRFRDSLPDKTTADAAPPSLLAPNPVIPALSFCFPLSSCEPKLTPVSIRTALPPPLPPLLSFRNPTPDPAFEYTEPLLSFSYASPTTHGEIYMAMLKSGSSISINQEMSENGDEDEGKDFRWSPDPGGTTMPICRVAAASLGGATIPSPRKLDESLVAYQRALLNQWNLDDKSYARIQTRFVVLLLYGGELDSIRIALTMRLEEHGLFEKIQSFQVQENITKANPAPTKGIIMDMSLHPDSILPDFLPLKRCDKDVEDEVGDGSKHDRGKKKGASLIKQTTAAMYVARGSFSNSNKKSALKLFDEMPQRVAISWNAMVKVPVKNIFSELGISPLVHIIDTGSSKVKEDPAKNLGNFCNYSKDIRACVQIFDDVPALLWLLKKIFKIFDPGGLLMFSTLTSPPMQPLHEVELF